MSCMLEYEAEMDLNANHVNADKFRLYECVR